MADYNIQQKTLNSGGTYDNLYPKSKAGLVDIADTAGHFASTDVEGALAETAAQISTHTANTSNPHGVTKSQVGLVNVTNESKSTMFTNPVFSGTPKVGTNIIYHAGNFTASKFASGSFSDTTTSVVKSSIYTKTIPLGFAGKSGRMMLTGGGPNEGFYSGTIVFFNTTEGSSNAMHVYPATGRLDAHVVLNKLRDNRLSVGGYGDYIDLFSCYISGANLVVKFKNTSDSLGDVLDVCSATWEVFA